MSVLQSVSAGSPEHPRFLIRSANGLFWTGEKWSRDPASAMVYANTVLLKRDMARLEKQLVEEEPLRFQVRCFIDVESDVPLDLDQLKHHLQSTFTINSLGWEALPPELHDIDVEATILWPSLKQIGRKKRS